MKSKVGKVHIAEDYHPHVEWFVDPLELDQKILYVNTWQGLTEDEFEHINNVTSGVRDFARMIENKLREKNG